MNLLPVEVLQEDGRVTLLLHGGRLTLPPEGEHLLERLTSRHALLGFRPEHVRQVAPGCLCALVGVVHVELLGRRCSTG
jgi:hypothetical protein